MRLLSETQPDKIHHHGRAWRLDIGRIERDIAERRKKPVEPHAQVCGWVVEATWANPFWHSYLITAVRLRPIPGKKPPVILLPNATHEVFLHALDPERDVNIDDPGMYVLTPVNFAGQWVAGTDFEAERKIEDCVDRIIRGNLSPDTDYVRHWVELFSASNLTHS